MNTAVGNEVQIFRYSMTNRTFLAHYYHLTVEIPFLTQVDLPILATLSLSYNILS
jgi:hypothetical protein